jgi:DNA polymerase-3 subunit delta'
MDITWHKSFADAWLERVRQDRLPHAVMLAGPAGTGKRAAAAWMAAGRLGIGKPAPMPQYPAPRLEHADLHWLAPPEDKASIGIEQIRDLVHEISLTSYAGGGKVAVIEPANAMTTNAANSLLKTLEEPPGDALLVLVADRAGNLPATIFSRCQRIEFLPPPEAEALTWLDRVRPGVAWQEALRLAGNSPLAAIEALEQLDTHAAMTRDFGAVAGGRASPVEVAAGWSGLEPSFVLDWLARQVQELIRRQNGVSRDGSAQGIDESVLRRMDSRNMFCYLDTIIRLRAQPKGSFNAQLAYEGLLIDLSKGLAGLRQRLPMDGLQHMLAER